MKLDLHLHTVASDGTWQPQRVAETARERRLAAWAIADHDTVEGYRAVAGAPGLLCGCEFSTLGDGREVHLVGLGFDPEHQALAARMAANRATRLERAEAILDHVARRRGVRIQVADCLQQGAAMITRSHIATALVRHGVVAHRQQAFDELIGDDLVRDLYHPTYGTTAETAGLIRDAGGVAVLAHPGMYGDVHRIERLMAGVDGIEIKHPNLDPALQALLRRRAEEAGWLLSCGSDFHVEPCRIGDWRLSRGEAAPLLRAAGWRDPITDRAA